MNPFYTFVRESSPSLGVGSDAAPAVSSNPTVSERVADLATAPTTLVVSVVFGLLTLVGLKFLATRKNKGPTALVMLALIAGTATSFLSSADAPDGLRALVQGYRTFIDGFFFGLAMLVAILHLGVVLFPKIRNVSPPKGAAIAAGMFFVIFGLSSIPEISETTSVRAILISLSGTLCLAAALLVNTYVTDGLSKLGTSEPGGVKLLSLAAWFWLFYPLTAIISVFLLSDNASLFVYDVVHLLAVTLSSLAVYLLAPVTGAAVGNAAKQKTATADRSDPAPAVTPVSTEQATSGTEASPATRVMRKPETPKTVIGRPVRPPKPQPPTGAGTEGKEIPKAPPPPKPKRRY